jgi:hypothetical protein
MKIEKTYIIKIQSELDDDKFSETLVERYLDLAVPRAVSKMINNDIISVGLRASVAIPKEIENEVCTA